MYLLFHQPTANLLGAYDTQAEALEHAVAEALGNGIDEYQLAFSDDDDVVLIAEGRALTELATVIDASPQDARDRARNATRYETSVATVRSYRSADSQRTPQAVSSVARLETVVTA